MTFRITLYLVLCAVGSSVTQGAEGIEDLKGGIVKITARVAGKTQVGTGFIVRLDKNSAYIVTAAHVIEGDPAPKVAFYPRANEVLPASVLGIEGGDPRGVAAVVVKGSIPTSARAFAISSKLEAHGGEAVTAIGFPAETGTPWMVATGTIGGRKGSDLTFSGVVGEGNSGGPLLFNGKVIGVIMQMGNKIGYALPIATARFTVEGWGVQMAEYDEGLLPKEIVGKDGMKMVLVPAGDFLMGPGRQQVYLDAFYVEKKQESATFWRTAETYCRNHLKRLPTEAEWEKAARRHVIPSGDVPEWTGDWYQRDYPQIRALRNPAGPPNGEPNDRMIAQFDSQARMQATHHVEFVCAGDSGYGPPGHHEPKCDAARRSRELEYFLRQQESNRPRPDMKKVVRENVETRAGAFSLSQSAFAFRCVSPAR